MSPRDRTGDLVDDTDEHTCDHGWLSRDDARPCLTCRPWLRFGRPPTKPELAEFEARHPRPTRETR